MARGEPLIRQWNLLKALQAHRFGIRINELAAALLCVGASLLLTAGLCAGEDRPAFRFAAIADTHISHARDLTSYRKFLFTLRKEKVDFLLVLGDLCGHAPEFLPRMKDVADHSGLKVHPLPGNHDDNYARNPEWFRRPFGRTHYSFNHKGYHFVMNWSQSQPTEWLARDLAAVAKGTPIVFSQHYPPKDDAAKAGEPWASLARCADLKLILTGHWHSHREWKLGEVPGFVLDKCFFTPWTRRPGSYYLCQARPDGRVTVRRMPLSGLKLLDPPDATPTVAVAAPAPGAILRKRAAFRGTATDDRAVSRVEWRVDSGPWRPAGGKSKWSFAVDTARLTEGHHVFGVRAIDSAGQPSIAPAGVLCLVENRPPAPGRVYRFQQGVGGYAGCTDVTVRRHGDAKHPSGSDGQVSDLENWHWKRGEVEFSEFYIRFDLSKSKLPPAAKIKRITLTLWGSRQNSVKSDQDPCFYAVGVMGEKWSPKMTFKTRPASPGWLAKENPAPAPALTGRWPYLGGRQIVWPPKSFTIDLTKLKPIVARWLADPSTNHGLVFSPATGSKNYNFSAQSARSPVATVRPRLEIEIEPR